MNKELELYELILLLKHTSTEAETTEKVEHYRDFLTEKGSQVMVKNHGKRSLSYPIRGFETATFIQLVYCGNGNLITDIGTQIKRDESVLRSITTKLQDENVSDIFANSL